MLTIKHAQDAEANWQQFLTFCNENAKDNRWYFARVTNADYLLIPKIGRSHTGQSWFDTKIVDGREK